MINKNKVILQGNIGSDIKYNVTSESKEVANFTLATNHFWKNENDEKQNNVTWHNIVAWGKNAVFADKYLSKGLNIEIEGYIQYKDLPQDLLMLEKDCEQQKIKYIKDAVIVVNTIQIASTIEK